MVGPFSTEILCGSHTITWAQLIDCADCLRPLRGPGPYVPYGLECCLYLQRFEHLHAMATQRRTLVHTKVAWIR
jgi:hypothetical protein